MCLITESSFTEICLPKSKPFTVGILHNLSNKIDFVSRPRYKIDFVNCVDQIFSRFNTIEIQECYLLMGFNINLLLKQ